MASGAALGYRVPMTFPPWQQVAWHQRRSYWELDGDLRRELRGDLEREAAALARNADAALEAYADRPGTLDGQLVNGDLLALLLPSLRNNPTQGYEALTDPEGRAAVHLNALGKRLRDRALARAAGLPVIVFMGGQASGKTTGALALGAAFGAVFDAPHAEADELAFLLARLERAGCPEIHVAWTDRGPEDSLRAMLARSEREGRYVPLDRMARAHAGAPEAFLALGPRRGGDLHLYHIQVHEEEPGTVREGAVALAAAAARERPPESVIAYRLQTAYIALLRLQSNDPQAWYPRDVLAGLNRGLDPWRRDEADHLLRRFFRAVEAGGPEAGAGP